MSAIEASTVLQLDRLDLRVDASIWNFAVERRAEIDALFVQMQRAQPALFNGRVLLMHDYAIEGGELRGTFLETDYASFVAWQRWGRQDAGVFDCFGSAAIQAADGAFLLGVMGSHTFNSGHIYFPCGIPDPSDIVSAGRLDFDFSVRRELREETGLDAALLAIEPGWTIVTDGALMAVIKVMRSPLGADALRSIILKNLSREQQPEFSDIRIVRSVADFEPTMRKFVKEFLTWRFART